MIYVVSLVAGAMLLVAGLVLPLLDRRLL